MALPARVFPCHPLSVSPWPIQYQGQTSCLNPPAHTKTPSMVRVVCCVQYAMSQGGDSNKGTRSPCRRRGSRGSQRLPQSAVPVRFLSGRRMADLVQVPLRRPPLSVHTFGAQTQGQRTPPPYIHFNLGPPGSQAYYIPATRRRGEDQPTRQQRRNLFPSSPDAAAACCTKVGARNPCQYIHDGSTAPIYPRRWVSPSQSPVPVSCPAVRADRLFPLPSPYLHLAGPGREPTGSATNPKPNP